MFDSLRLHQPGWFAAKELTRLIENSVEHHEDANVPLPELREQV